MAFFDSFYKLSGFYGDALYNHLRGWDDTISYYNEAYNQFPSICIVTALICLGVFLVYYYIVNYPRWNRWFWWLTALGAVAVSTYILAFATVMVDVRSGEIAPSLIPYISNNNAVLFGIYNLLLASLSFFLLSLLFRHWSKNCKHSPWTSIFTRLKYRK